MPDNSASNNDKESPENLKSEKCMKDAIMDDNNDSTVETVTTNSDELPKHIPYPEFAGNSELLNELLMFLFITFAAAMQFINIYRTNWWVGTESYINHKVNFYLIEPYLIALIIIISARRFVYCLLLKLVELIKHNKQQRFYRKVLRYSFGNFLLVLLGFCVLQIGVRYSYVSIFLLGYPIVVYLLIFGFQMEPFLRSSCEEEGTYFNGMPLHCCSSSPVNIREEIETLRRDFFNRLKQAVFTSVLNAYYAGLVPCFFAVSIYYNVIWVFQHVFFIWISGFTLCSVFFFPSKYSDILHRASLHIGHWSRVDIQSNGFISPSASNWNKNILWTNGTIVRHCGDLFQCTGPVTVAVPGNCNHARFYKLFHNPSFIYMGLTAVQATIIIAEIVLLCFVIEWHFVLSISFITLTNQFTFFKLMRDYLITKRLYTTESSISDNKFASVRHLN